MVGLVFNPRAIFHFQHNQYFTPKLNICVYLIPDRGLYYEICEEVHFFLVITNHPLAFNDAHSVLMYAVYTTLVKAQINGDVLSGFSPKYIMFRKEDVGSFCLSVPDTKKGYHV